MWLTIGIVLLVIWGLGFFLWHLGTFIWLALILAAAAFVWHWVSHRPTAKTREGEH